MRVKLKNAIMQSWSDIKEGSKPPSLQDMIDKILEKQRQDKKKGKDNAELKEQEELKLKKSENKRQRLEREQQQKEDEAKTSYLKIH